MRTAIIARTYDAGRARAEELSIGPRDRVIVTPTTHPGAVAGVKVIEIDDTEVNWMDLNTRTWNHLRAGHAIHGKGSTA